MSSYEPVVVIYCVVLSLLVCLSPCPPLLSAGSTTCLSTHVLLEINGMSQVLSSCDNSFCLGIIVYLYLSSGDCIENGSVAERSKALV